MVFCPECWEENDANANFCFSCGAPIKTEIPAELEKEIDRLIIYLNSVGSSIRNKAVNRLVTIGEPAFQPVVEASTINNSLLRRKTCDVLGLMGDPRAVTPLVRLLMDKNRHVRSRAANALILVGDESAVKPLCAALNDTEPKVRARAAKALSNIGDESAIPSLVTCLNDPNSEVSMTAEKAIDKLRLKVKNPMKTQDSQKVTEAKRDENIELILVERKKERIEKETNKYISHLKSSNRKKRNKAVEELVKIGPPTFKLLIKASKHDNKVTRRKVCDVLGLMGDPNGLSTLITLLVDEDRFVRRRAANALIELNNEEVIEPLCAALNDSEEKVRLRAAKALGNIGDQRSIDALIDSSMDYDIDVREESVVALDKIGWEPGTDERSIKFLIGQNEYYRCAEIGEPAIVPLINEFNSYDSELRNKAVRAIVTIGKPAVDPLIKALNYSDPVIVRKACDALGFIGGPEAVVPLTKRLKDPDAYVRRRAANALIKLGDENAVKPLITALNDSETKVRSRAAEALGNIGDDRAIYGLIEVSLDSDNTVREKSLEALNKIGWEPGTDERSIKFLIGHKKFNQCAEIGEPAIVPLINSFNSTDSETRNGAVQALVTIGTSAVDPLIKALNRSNAVIRRKSCDALGLINDSSAVIPLTEMLIDSDENVRRRAANALINVGDERSVEPLCEALNDSETKVRVRAATALGRIGDESALSSLVLCLNDLNPEVSEAAEEAIKKFGTKGQKAINEYNKELLKKHWESCKEFTHDDFNTMKDLKDVNGLIKVLKGDLVYKNDSDPVIDEINRNLGYISPDMNVTFPCVAASELAKIGDECAITHLSDTLQNEYVDKSIRSACLRALNNMGTIEAYNVITNSLPYLDGHSDLFRDAVMALEMQGLNLMEEEGDIDGLIKAFSMYDIDRNMPISGFALGHLQDLHDNGAPVVEHILSAMDDESYKNSKYCIKCHFVRALGSLGDISAVDPLIRIMNTDPEPKVRHWATLSLYTLGYRDVFDTLIEIFKNSGDYFRIHATIAFRHAHEKLAVEEIVNGLISSNEEVRGLSADALGEIGDPSAVWGLISVSNDPVISVREYAILSLCKIGDKRAYQTFIEKLKDESPYIRRVATKALNKLSESTVDLDINGLISDLLSNPDPEMRIQSAETLCTSDDDIFIDKLITTLKDSTNHIERASAAESFGNIANILQERENALIKESLTKTVAPLIKALKDPSHEVRSLSSWSLGNIAEIRAVEPLIKSLNDSNSIVGTNAAFALGNIGDPRAVEPLIKTLENDNFKGRITSVAALGNIGDIRALEPLIKTLGDPDEDIQDLAARIISVMGNSAVLPLINALENENKDVQAYSASILGNIGDNRAVMPLIKVLENPPNYHVDPHPNDPEWDVQVASAISLGIIGDDRAIEPLEKASVSSNEYLSNFTSEALEKIGNKGQKLKAAMERERRQKELEARRM